MNKKGCIIALIVFAVLVLAGSIVGFTVFLPKAQKLGTASIIFVVETAINQYSEATGAFPTGSHEEIVEMLSGKNPDGKNYFEDGFEKAVVNGKIIDAWNRPLQIEAQADGTIKVLSAGGNGEFGDDDDVTSESLRKLMENIEKKAATEPRALEPKPAAEEN